MPPGYCWGPALMAPRCTMPCGPPPCSPPPGGGVSAWRPAFPALWASGLWKHCTMCRDCSPGCGMLGLPSGGPRPMPGIPCGPPGIGPVGVLEASGCGLFGLCFCRAVLEVAGPLWEDGGILGPPGPMLAPPEPMFGPPGPMLGPLGPPGPMLGPPGPMFGPPGPMPGPPGPCHPGGMELLLAPWPGMFMPGPPIILMPGPMGIMPGPPI